MISCEKNFVTTLNYIILISHETLAVQFLFYGSIIGRSALVSRLLKSQTLRVGAQ